MLHNGHVRVDIFYRPANLRYKAMIDLLGSLFLLLPLVLVITYVSVDYVFDSCRRLLYQKKALPATDRWRLTV